MKKILAVGVLFLAGTVAHADDVHWELSANSNAALSFFNTAGNTTGEFVIGTAAQYWLTPSIEAGLSASYVFLSSGSVNNNFVTGEAMGTFNFLGSSPNTAFFFTIEGGVSSGASEVSGGTTNVPQFVIGAGVGKRIPITGNIVWKPEVSYTFEGSASYTDPSFGPQTIAASRDLVLTLFQFSILL